MSYSCRTWTWFDPARATNREWLSKKNPPTRSLTMLRSFMLVGPLLMQLIPGGLMPFRRKER